MLIPKHFVRIYSFNFILFYKIFHRLKTNLYFSDDNINSRTLQNLDEMINEVDIITEEETQQDDGKV